MWKFKEAFEFLAIKTRKIAMVFIKTTDGYLLIAIKLRKIAMILRIYN